MLVTQAQLDALAKAQVQSVSTSIGAAVTTTLANATTEGKE